MKSQCQPKSKGYGNGLHLLMGGSAKWNYKQMQIQRKGKRGPLVLYSWHCLAYCIPVSHGLFLLELLVLHSLWPTVQNDMRQTLWIPLPLCLIEMPMWPSVTRRRDGMVFSIGTLGTHCRNVVGVNTNSSYIISYGSHDGLFSLINVENLCMCSQETLSQSVNLLA